MRRYAIYGAFILFLSITFESYAAPAFFRNHSLISSKVISKIPAPKWYHEGIYYDGKNIWVANGEKGKIWVLDASSGSIIKEIEPIGTFTESINPYVNGLFFVSDWDAEKIYTVRIENDRMTAQKEFSLAPAHPAGAIWNGYNLFVITWMRGITGTRFSLLKMDDKFKVISKKRIDKIQEPTQLAWDGKNLWISSWYSKRVYKLDPQKLEIVGYFNSPVERTTGIAWDGSRFWLTGTYADLYKIELQN